MSAALPVPRRAGALLVLTVLALLGTAGAAGGHTALAGSDPADGASLATPPAAVALTFTQPVQRGLSTVTVTGPDGAQWQAGPALEPDAAGTTVTVGLRPLGPAGEYTVAYQVLAADSHPVRGALRFTLTAPGPAAAPPPTPPPVPAAATTRADDGAPLWPWVLAAGVLVGVGAVAARRVGRSG